MSRFTFAGTIAIAGLMATAAPALAEHGKAGQWEIKVKNEYPDLPRTTVSDRARLEAQGIRLPDTRTKHLTHCMTAEEVDSNDLPKMDDKNQCAVSNPKIEGNTFSAHLVCTGKTKGEGGMTVTYDKPEHYSGIARLEGAFMGQAMEVISRFEGTWTSPTCTSDD